MGAKRNFSKKQRLTLLLLSGGRCGLCGDEINEYNFHADHIIPYSLGGKTVVRNGQALCITCNLKKGTNLMDSKRLPLRKCQQGMYNTTKEVWTRNLSGLYEKQRKPLIVAAPGSGKTYAGVCLVDLAMSKFGIDSTVIVVPTIHIKNVWIKELNTYNIMAYSDRATNADIMFKDKAGGDVLGKRNALVLTYAQLSYQHLFYTDLVAKHNTFVMGDEVHHADDNATFGVAMSSIAKEARLTAALSATPFNTVGGLLSMCDFEETQDKYGYINRMAIPTFEYSLREAIDDGVCRPVQFIYITGKVEELYRDAETGKPCIKSIDLETPNSNENFTSLLRPDGEFFEEMVLNSMQALVRAKTADPKAAMLVLAIDIRHGNGVTEAMRRICARKPEWSSFKFKEIYGESENASKQISELAYDDTDIVVTVKIISEGINVNRLKVLLYATVYKTRLFVIQSVGRIQRIEPHLGSSQFATMILPAHHELRRYCDEIETQCKSIPIRSRSNTITEIEPKKIKDPEAEPKTEPKVEPVADVPLAQPISAEIEEEIIKDSNIDFEDPTQPPELPPWEWWKDVSPGERKRRYILYWVDSKTTLGPSYVMFRGRVEHQREYASALFNIRHDLSGSLTEDQAADIWRYFMSNGGCSETGPSVTPDTQGATDAPFMGLVASVNYDAVEKERETVNKKSRELVKEIVGLCKEFTGDDSGDDSKYYAWINKEANRAVNITRKDNLTPIEILHDRLKWLVHFHYKIKKTPTELNKYYILFNNKNKSKPKYNHGMV